jgi:hypothetical protein
MCYRSSTYFTFTEDVRVTVGLTPEAAGSC